MSSSPLKVEPGAKAQEPSMEEILASIRKIISDDDAKPARAAPMRNPRPEAAPVAAPQGQDDIDALLADFDAASEEPDILELTEDMVAPDSQAPDPGDLDFVEFEQSAPSVAPQQSRPETPLMLADPGLAAPRPPQVAEERLISSATDSAISAAFGSLTHTILSQNARTLDDLVQDMLRPMLKAWLDDNLPSLVERLVRAEIERVSRGGR
jgi:cell pole-organizing protein PopZ